MKIKANKKKCIANVPHKVHFRGRDYIITCSGDPEGELPKKSKKRLKTRVKRKEVVILKFKEVQKK